MEMLQKRMRDCRSVKSWSTSEVGIGKSEAAKMKGVFGTSTGRFGVLQRKTPSRETSSFEGCLLYDFHVLRGSVAT